MQALSQALHVLNTNTKTYLNLLPQRQANASPVADELTARIKTSLNISNKNERKKMRKGLNIFVCVDCDRKPVNKITARHPLLLSATVKGMGIIQ